MTRTPSASTLQWRQADADVYVATSDGEYAGFVASTTDGVEAHGPHGEHLGLHRSSALARAAVTRRPGGGSHSRAASARPQRPRGARSRGTTGRTRGPKE